MTPVNLIGRVFSVVGSVTTAARILGIPLAGVIAGLIGVINVYRAVGVTMIVIAIAGFALSTRFRASMPSQDRPPVAETPAVGQD